MTKGNIVARSCVVVFDLDDTLYLERDFVWSGFRAASRWYENISGFAGLDHRCVELFEAGNRVRIFDAALESLGIDRSKDLVAKLVEVYRTHRPEISLAMDADHYLRRWSAKRPLALVTDGVASTQMGKVDVLGLNQLLDHLIYTGEWGRDFWKPHARAFEAIEARFDANPRRLVYVADNPTKDFVAPRARGWWTVQIARPERVHHVVAPDPTHDAHTTILSMDALDDCLAKLDPIWALVDPYAVNEGALIAG